jgi:hypothetical protein
MSKELQLAQERVNRLKSSRYREVHAKSATWTGDESLNGKRVILYCEQGNGDTIQFLRYLPQLIAMGCEIVAHANSSLHVLFRHFGIEKCLGWQDQIPEHDFHVLMLDLPFLFLKNKPTIQWWWEGTHRESYMPEIMTNLPLPPYLNYDQTENLETEGLKIGIAWEGNPVNPGNEYRCCPLKYFQNLPGSLFCLQRDVFLPNLYEGWERELLGVKIENYFDTARLINSLDLVITVDTSILHLAGALNKRTFGLLGYNHDPRWADSLTTPWYPSIRFFRNRNGWDKVFKAIKKLI